MAAPPGVTEEKRVAHRRRMLKPGRIVSNRNTVFDCMVRDLSPTGARLLVPSIMGIPDQFMLLIGQASYSCRVVWRSWTALGVTFEDQSGPCMSRFSDEEGCRD